MDFKGLVNFREKACDKNECVEPESIKTYTFWAQMEIIPDTTDSVFCTSLGTSANTLPCLNVSFPALPLVLVLAFDLTTEANPAEVTAGRVALSSPSGQSFIIWPTLPHQ